MTVNNVNALLGYAGQTEPAGVKQGEPAQDAFNKVMAKVSDTVAGLKTELAGNASAVSGTVQTAEAVSTAKQDTAVQKTDAAQDAKQTQTPEQTAKTEDATQQKDNTNTEAADTVTDDQTQQAVEEVEKTAGELVQDIAKEMDVTPEEVEAAMAVLGLTAVQLFDTDNLKQLLLQLTGSSDELALVTDETLYGNLQNLFTTVEEAVEGLTETLDMTEEEMHTLVEQIVTEQTKAQGTEAEADIVPAEETPEQAPTLEGMKDYTVSVQRDGATVQVKVTVDDASGSKTMQEQVTDEAPKMEVQTGHKTRERGASADSGRGESQNAHAFMQTLERTPEVNETPEPVHVEYRSVQTEEIMNQIMDYMKINLKAESQELQMQLHPASLGTVGVQIAAKDGVITAHFTTQNETVRAVIETQMIQLKNQFEEQGIKVDAVEVTVANHAYGQQFSQEQEQAEQQQNKASKGTRRLNLEELGEEAELDELEDSERIAVELMQANGGTVDYTA